MVYEKRKFLYNRVNKEKKRYKKVVFFFLSNHPIKVYTNFYKFVSRIAYRVSRYPIQYRVSSIEDIVKYSVERIVRKENRKRYKKIIVIITFFI